MERYCSSECAVISLIERRLMDFTSLYSELLNLRSSIEIESHELLKRWSFDARLIKYDVDAINLAQYISMRKRDLSDLQFVLSSHGLSSLGRNESKVMTALDSLIVSVGLLARIDENLVYPSAEIMKAGHNSIATSCDRIFGNKHDPSRTRIIATLSTEAAFNAEYVDKLVASGMDCARINCGHDDQEVWAGMVENVRKSALKFKRDIKILMDISGPKCRIIKVQNNNNARIHRGDIVFLARTKKRMREDYSSFCINFDSIISKLVIGSEVSIDDGRAFGIVNKLCEDGAIIEITKVREKGLVIKADKGISFPSVEIDIPVLTPKDYYDLDFIAQHADMVGFSFVQRPQDIELLQDHLSVRQGNRDPHTIILKIETPLAVKNLPILILQSALHNPTGVMIARGDLAIEIGFPRLSEIQEEIIWLCEAAHVPVIWATEVLNQFTKEGIMSRTEMTDAAMSQRAESVMINKGKYLAEAICLLKDIVLRMDRHYAKKFARYTPLHTWDNL